jgi:hypothetical protein
MPDIDYSNYTNLIGHIVSTKDLSNFKSFQVYRDILEHVSMQQGLDYYSLIKNNSTISKDEIIEYCSMNDKLGNPIKSTYDDFSCSPTSLRYIWHTHLILSYFKSFNKTEYDIVEIGGGYGGLCLAICHFAPKYDLKIKSYTIVDLKEPNDLQKVYLSNYNLSVNLDFVNAGTYGMNINKENLYLISNYCFSEISSQNQLNYIKSLFSKVQHGFMAWNMIPTYYFGFEFREEPETPNTGPFNKFIYF